jgi:hypothetical protein
MHRPLKVNGYFGGTYLFHVVGWRVNQSKEPIEADSKQSQTKNLESVIWALHSGPETLQTNCVKTHKISV